MSATTAVGAINKAVRDALKWDRDAMAFRVLRFGRHREGYLQAQVRIGDDEVVYVHRALGSWMIPHEPQSVEVTGQFRGRFMLQVLEPYSYLLAEEARRFEEQERRMLIAQELAESAERQRELVAQLHPKGGPMMSLEEAVQLLKTIGYPRDEKIKGLMEVYGLTEADAEKALDETDELTDTLA